MLSAGTWYAHLGHQACLQAAIFPLRHGLGARLAEVRDLQPVAP